MYPFPGTPVYVNVGLVKHRGIVSDRWQGGAPMVISNSARADGTREEPWGVFANGGQVYLDELELRLPGWLVVVRARSWIGQPYSALGRNCDHHVRHALGLDVWSPQVWGALALAGVLVLAIGAAITTARRAA